MHAFLNYALLENINLLVDCLFGSKISWTPYIFKMDGDI
jgi:hypothetical protein